MNRFLRPPLKRLFHFKPQLSRIMASSEREVLPKNVVPLHYRVFLDPDLEKYTYTGKVSIDVDVVETSKSVTLNVLDLVLRNPKLGSVSAINTEEDKQAQTAKFTFAEELEAGTKATLSIEFDGTLNDKMCGFYRSVHKDENGVQKVVATTQMEATDCRRAFPCFDEPSLKATFDISIAADPKLTVLSNNSVSKVEKLDNGKQITHFNSTPKMSTYLVAFIVGELNYVESNLFRVPVRVYATPGLENRCQFSADLAAKTLAFFEKTFKCEYPLPKCDMVGLHDFSAGAMENWGLITYRLVDIFYVEGVDSDATKTRVAEVVQHELAHQWFGNLVTMEWWDGLWLNEGFATWMSWYSANNFFPDWNVWETYVNEAYLGCLSLDGLRSSHPIQVEVKNADEVSQIFDHISYLKGSSVIRMVSKFLGEDVFMEGIANYLKKHAYGNTVTSDLWAALSEHSGKDVQKFMNPWVLKTGYPVLSVSDVAKDGTVEITQHRYLETGDLKPDEDQTLFTVWLATRKADGSVDQKDMLTNRSGKFKVGSSNDAFFKLNADQTGIYRVKYSDKVLEKLIKEGERGPRSKLSVADRIGVISDLHAFSGTETSTTQLLSLFKAWRLENEANVLTTLISSMVSVGAKLTFETKEFRDLYKKFTKQVITAIAKHIGPQLEQNTDVRLSKLKSVIYSVAVSSDCQFYIDSSLSQFREHKFKVDPDLRSAIYAAVAKYGTEREWRSLLQHYLDGTNGASGNSALRALGNTIDLKRKREILKLVIDGTIRSQDVFYAIGGVTGSDPEGVDIAWEWMTTNWTKLREIFPSSISLMSYIIESIVSKFTKQKQLERVEKFFANKDLKGINMSLAQATERVKINIKYINRDGKNIHKWLKENVM